MDGYGLMAVNQLKTPKSLGFMNVKKSHLEYG